MGGKGGLIPTTESNRRNHLKVTELQIYTSDERGGVSNVIRCVPAHTFGRRTKVIIITITLMLFQPSLAEFLHKGHRQNTPRYNAGWAKPASAGWRHGTGWVHGDTTVPVPAVMKIIKTSFPRSCFHLVTPTFRRVKDAPILPHTREEDRKWTR